MADFDYDLFVIGGGSGGVRAARLTAADGHKVGVAEESRFGGTCVIRGCVPKKLMMYASLYPKHFEDARGYGWSLGEAPTHDWRGFKAARDAEISRLEGFYESGLTGNGADIFHDRAVVDDPHTVRLVGADKTFRTKHILLATGGKPRIIDIPGAELGISSDDIFELTERPEEITIIGGGYVAAEFAGIFHGLGSRVTLAYRGDLWLRGFDRDVRDAVTNEMRKLGVEILFNTDIERIEDLGGGKKQVHLQGGLTRTADQVLLATGRVPQTAEMGLDEVGVTCRANGGIEVDEYSQTGVPSIYAVGDVTSRLELTPVAIREGVAFHKTVFRGEPTVYSHELVPTAIFTQPEIGTVGLSEDSARIDHDVDVWQAEFRPMQHVMANRDERMLMKMVVEQGSDRVLGAHIMGHGAGEMIQFIAVALRMGATREDFMTTTAVHPTAAEEFVTMKKRED